MAGPLPVYSPSAPSPIYSVTPGSNEHILQRMPLPGYSRLTGTFIRNARIITLVVDGRRKIFAVAVLGEARYSLEGILESLSPSRGCSSLKIVAKYSSLYVQEGSQRRCPTAIPFSLRFLPTFNNNGAQYPLPPFCDIALPHCSFLKCTYSLTVTVIAALHRSVFEKFTDYRSLSIELEHRQRTRPSRPKISLFSTIATCPEEWLQIPVALTAGPDLDPSDCDLFVPSVGVFGINEIIPFHLQLSGSIRSIRKLVLQSNPEGGTHNQTIRVHFLRQIKVNAGTTKINTILGRVRLGLFRRPSRTFLPQTFKHTINWEGELQLQDLATPTFDAGTFGVMVSAQYQSSCFFS
ncbi:hypothetical protein C8R44DRAFT_603811 [Mycena epipterygia]|nr:hypothetical protein C8R44DRAFT_603811 [Mycena epipterygia]